MSVSMIQASFQFGEVTRLMHARVDSPIYYRAVKRLRNMVVIPQGGAKRRFGTNYIDQISDHAASPTYITNYTQVKPFIFDYENGDRYLLIFRASAVDIYLNGVYQSTTGTPYGATEIADLSITQSARIVFIAHGSYAPRTLIRASTGPVVLTLTTPTFIEYPTFDFKQTYESFTFKIKVGGVDIVTAQNLLGQVVTLHSSSALFDTNYVGGLFIGEGGVLRITAYTSTTQVTARIVNVFDNESSLFHAGAGNAIAGADCVVTEIAFSSTRGYPQKVSFFQNRIFFGRTSTLAGGIWGSNYNGYTSDKLHFDDSDVLDTNAISTILQGTKASLIQHMVAFKTLLVFTTSGLYSSPLLIDLPLTPQNISFLNPQTSDAANNVVPLIFDNDVIFFDKGGRKVKNVNVYATTQHYESKVISVLAPHLVDQPYSAAVFENSSTEDGSWMFMVNNGTRETGSLAIYQSVPEQEITAWSLSNSADTQYGDAYFRHVVSDEETTFFVVERYVDGLFNPTSVLVVAVNQTAALSLGGAGNITMFVADNDTITVGYTAKFNAIKITLDTAASANIVPTFEYSTGVGTWATFTPTDNTNGFTGSNVISIDIDSIPGWVVGAGAEYLIRITRTVNVLATSPIVDTVGVFIPDTKRLFIEQLDFDTYTDCAKTGTQALSSTIGGLSYLEGETVAVRGLTDGATLQSVVSLDAVVTGGSITLDTEVTDYEVGLLWTPEIVPLPLNVPMPQGNNLYLPKNIKKIYVDFYESLGIYVDGNLIPPFRFNQDEYDDAAEPKTDFVQIEQMSGWDASAEISITQQEPLPMTLLGIGFIVST